MIYELTYGGYRLGTFPTEADVLSSAALFAEKRLKEEFEK